MRALATLIAIGWLAAPAPARAAGACDLSLGWESGCAILDDGGLACWGPSAPAPDRVGLDEPTRIAAPPDLVDVGTSEGVTCVVDRAGAVSCLGNDPMRAPGSSSYERAWTKVAGVPAAVAVDVSRATACALTRAGEVYCWGDNEWGVAPASRRGEPVRIDGLRGIEELAIGTYGACARARDGRVACWGTIHHENPPVESDTRLVWIKVPRAARLRMGDDAACIMTAAGAVHCWAGRDEVVALEVPAGAIDLAVGSDTCVLLKDGHVACRDEPSILAYTGEPDRGDAFGVLPGLAGIARVELGQGGGCALDGAGAMSCWGTGELFPRRVPWLRSTPVAVVGLRDVTAIDAFEYTTCAVAGGAVSCWGGDAGPDARPHQVAGVSDAVDVRIGDEGACARLRGGQVACWTFDDRGRALRGTGDGDRARPDPIRGAAVVPGVVDVTGVAVGVTHACAVRGDGSMVCWGDPVPALFGAGEAAARATPTRALGVASGVASAADRTCAIRRDDGTVVCVGRSADPAVPMGDGKPAVTDRPVVVRGLRDVVQVDVGRRVACARTRQGTVACWGSGALVPVPWSGVADAVDVGAGAMFSSSEEGDQACVVRATGELRCGLPGHDRVVLTDAVDVAAGDGHLCALRRGGTVACWGHTMNGALGDGLGEHVMPPLPIALPAAAP